MAFVYYLLKVLICSGILFLYYQLALKNKLFHQWNRFYLLSAVLLSMLLPLLQFTIGSSINQVESKAMDVILLIQNSDNYLENFTISASSSYSTAEQWSVIAYGIVCLLLMVSFALSISKIVRLIKQHHAEDLIEAQFINTDEPGTPFSFLQYIFWNEKISLRTEAGQQIFQHELVHVKEKHTLDKLFMQVVLIFFWCNPFFWLIRRELKFVHEFIADRKAVGLQGTEAFAAIIMQATFPQHFNTITNQFFQTPIKRRLLMLTKTQNPKLAYFGRIVALPLVAITVLAFTVRTDKYGSNRILPTATEHSSGETADTIPKAKKQIGSVDVKKDATKKINEITITYEDGSSETLTEQEANRRGLINNGGYVNTKKGESKAPATEKQWKSEGSPNVLYIVDGQEMTKEGILKIDPNTVESINVLKGESAIEKYGAQGKEGVIIIQSKIEKSNERLSTKQHGEGSIGKDRVVEGYPLHSENRTANEKVKDETVVSGHPKKEKSVPSDDKEIVAVGQPLQRNSLDEPVFEKSEYAASVDKDEWREFLQKHSSPIVEDLSKKTSPGTYVVMVRFIVEKDGSLSNVEIKNDPGYGVGKKIADIMKHAPKWKPAIQNDRTVRSYHTQPITLVISKS